MLSCVKIKGKMYKSLLNILSLTFFAKNRLLITPQASPLMWYCSEKSILTKQINDSTYFFYVKSEKKNTKV